MRRTGWGERREVPVVKGRFLTSNKKTWYLSRIVLLNVATNRDTEKFQAMKRNRCQSRFDFTHDFVTSYIRDQKNEEKS